MRNLVEPLPSMHCEHCKGELLFKRIEVDDTVLCCAPSFMASTWCKRAHGSMSA